MQWTSPDTLIPDPFNPLDWNRYAYARYNPLRLVDPSGHSPCDIAGSDPECNDPGVSFYSQINERKAARRYQQHIPMVAGYSQPNTPSGASISNNPPGISSGNPSSSATSDAELLGLAVEAWGQVTTFEEALLFASNYGRPVYKHIKGISSLGGPTLEGALGAGTQLASDWNRSDLNVIQKAGRAIVTGGEDVLIDGVSTYIGLQSGAVGATVGVAATGETGPVTGTVGGFLGGGAGYLVGSYFSTRALDNFAGTTVNPAVFPYFFPK